MASKRNIHLNLIVILVAIVAFIKFKLSPFDRETKLSLGYHEDSLLNFTELTGKYGYTTEEHTVVTEDGYMLTVFHVTKSKKCRGPVKKTPVLLMHGLIESADLFIDAGPEAGLGYLIPDACFDLWVGNQRGNYYGRRHTHLDPKEAQFWQFSAEEMSYYDLPAMYDYILHYTGSEKLNFIGYSQGGANFFIMCPDRPEYCQKTKVMIALAPATILTNMRSPTLRLMIQGVSISRPVLEMLGINEVFVKGGIVQELFEFFCQSTDTAITDVLCGTGGAFFDTYHAGSINYDTQRTLFGHFPAGSSVHNFARYAQIMRSGRFQKYDYGEVVNLEKYGSKVPPEINMSAVTVPVVTVHGASDILTVAEDLRSIEGRLPNLVEAFKVVDPQWTHFDIVYSQFANEMVFPTVKKYLDKYSDLY